jgi:Ca2+-binding RTX toxin-like protein
MLGQQGRDTLEDARGNDRIDGGPGRDVLDVSHIFTQTLISGSRVPMTVNLTTGIVAAPRWFGRNRVRNIDVVWTGDGDDHIVGGPRPETFFAGAGYAGVDGRGGSDTIKFELPFASMDRVRVDLRRGIAIQGPHAHRPPQARISLAAIENVVGSSESDVILGDRHDNHLFGDPGGYGNDVIRGRGGNDHLFGAAGNDNLDGGTGRNSVDGGGGVDTCANPALGPRAQNCELVGRTD